MSTQQARITRSAASLARPEGRIKHSPALKTDNVSMGCAARRGRSLHCRAQYGTRRKLPLNTNGGGLSYMHSGMYGMYALQESVRQMRGIAPAQVPNAKISVCHGVGGMFAASGTIIMSNQPP